MRTFIFVNTGLNSVVRVKASTLDDAWIKYINRFWAKYLEEYTFKEARYELEHDIFVVDERTEVVNIG